MSQNWCVSDPIEEHKQSFFPILFLSFFIFIRKWILNISQHERNCFISIKHQIQFIYNYTVTDMDCCYFDNIIVVDIKSSCLCIKNNKLMRIVVDKVLNGVPSCIIQQIISPQTGFICFRDQLMGYFQLLAGPNAHQYSCPRHDVFRLGEYIQM